MAARSLSRRCTRTESRRPQKSSILRGACGTFLDAGGGTCAAALDNTTQEAASARLGPGTSTGPPQRALAKTANRPKVTFGPAPPVSGFPQFSHLRAGQYRGHDRCRGHVTSSGGRACRGKHATASVTGSSLSGILGLPMATLTTEIWVYFEVASQSKSHRPGYVFGSFAFILGS